MSAAKTLNQYGVLLVLETVAYGNGDVPSAATDGLLVVEMPDIERTPLHDGMRVGRNPGTATTPRRVRQSGFEAAVTFAIEALAKGSVYDGSTGVPPGGIHNALRIAGMAAAFTGTGDTAAWTYTPESTGFDSGSIEVYKAGQKYVLTGAYASGFTVTADGPVVPRWEFPVRGIDTPPIDSALPVITYPAATLLPPKAVNIALNLNGVTTLVCRGFTITHERELSPRANDNASVTNEAHAGFTPGARTTTLEVTIEAAAKATFDPDALRDASTILSACTLKVDDGDWLTYVFTFPNAQIINVDDGEDGSTATWILTIEAHPSTYVADDEFSLKFEK